MYLKSADIPDGFAVEKPKALTEAQLDALTLRAAVERVRKGWCQHAFAHNAFGSVYIHGEQRNTITRVCARGALILEGVREASLHEVRLTNHLAVQLVLDGLLDLDHSNAVREMWGAEAPLSLVPRWNNEPGRTQADVVGLFERTIARLEAA